MEVLSTILIIYGILCIIIGFLKPPFIWNMGKFRVMEKMMGKNGLVIFVIAWGILALVIGLLI
jgi:hypothetical protein